MRDSQPLIGQVNDQKDRVCEKRAFRFSSVGKSKKSWCDWGTRIKHKIIGEKAIIFENRAFV